MTPLPKRKHSRARKGKRRFAINLKAVSLVVCANCKEYKKPHTICSNCGYYDGKEIIAPKIKTKKNEKSS